MQRRVFVSRATTGPVEYRFRVYFPPGSHPRLSVQIPDEGLPHSCSLTIGDSDRHPGLEFVISQEDAEIGLSDVRGIPAPPPAHPQSPLALPPQTDGPRRYLTQ